MALKLKGTAASGAKIEDGGTYDGSVLTVELTKQEAWAIVRATCQAQEDCYTADEDHEPLRWAGERILRLIRPDRLGSTPQTERKTDAASE